MILELIISNIFFQTRFGGKSHPYALVQIKNFLMEQPCAINLDPPYWERTCLILYFKLQSRALDTRLKHGYFRTCVVSIFPSNT